MPATLPTVALLPKQKSMAYGLGQRTPHRVVTQVQQWDRWCTRAINLERGDRYIRGVQSETLAKQHDCIKVWLVGVVSSRPAAAPPPCRCPGSEARRVGEARLRLCSSRPAPRR